MPEAFCVSYHTIDFVPRARDSESIGMKRNLFWDEFP